MKSDFLVGSLPSFIAKFFTSEEVQWIFIWYLVVVCVEAFLLRRLIKNVPYKTIFWRSAWINFLSGILIVSFIYFDNRPEFKFIRNFFKGNIIDLLFIFSIIPETPFLLYLYQKEAGSWWRVVLISIGINVVSSVASFFFVVLPMTLCHMNP